MDDTNSPRHGAHSLSIALLLEKCYFNAVFPGRNQEEIYPPITVISTDGKRDYWPSQKLTTAVESSNLYVSRALAEK